MMADPLTTLRATNDLPKVEELTRLLDQATSGLIEAHAWREVADAALDELAGLAKRLEAQRDALEAALIIWSLDSSMVSAHNRLFAAWEKYEAEHGRSISPFAATQAEGGEGT
jgi:hypothetical protein